MQSRLKSIKNIFILFVLLFSLFGSSTIITPVYAAANITVNTAVDEDVNNANCSLREAITAANADSAYGGCPAGAGDDSITFTANYTITLGSQLPAVATNITITGNGAANTILQANASPDTATYRVLEVSAGGTLTLDGVTVRNGRCNGSCSTYANDGGGISNDGTLIVSNSVIANNAALQVGGGIKNLGTVTLTDVTLSWNISSLPGGGLYNSNSLSTLTNVTFLSNNASHGAGVYSQGLAGITTIRNSTFFGNNAGYGGGVYNYNGSLTITNNTFSMNHGSNNGGGVYNGGTFTSINTTFSENTTGGSGGGVYNSGVLNFTNTIVANSIGGDCVSTGSSGTNANNLVEDGSCFAGLSGDPLLAPLANNGGSTQTFALLPGSPAINAGTNTGCPVTDQRGMSRNGTCDIGSFEFNYGNVTIYAKPAASGSGDCLSWANACTLQTALTLSSSNVEIWVAAGAHFPTSTTDQNIFFVLKNTVALYGGFAGTETLRTQRNPSVNVTILSGDIDHNDSQTPIITNINTVTGNATNSHHVVTGSGTNNTAVLDGFTVTAGNGSMGNGGGMYNIAGSPSITNVTFSGNIAGGFGGGMYNYLSSPSITNVIFSGNSALDGGGMYNDSSSPILTNVIFSGNSANSAGGGMYNNNEGSANLTNVTFSANSASQGGGMFNINGGSRSLTNVTFSGNSASIGGGMFNNFSSPKLTNVIIANSTSGGDCFNSSSTINASSSNNLIEDASSACDLTNGASGNIIGLDPKLGPLANNGGSTRTFALLVGSPAINVGTNSGCPATDQRGKTRPQDGTCDIGAYERTVNPTFSDVPYSYWSWQYIEQLYNDGITGGCNAVPLNYCPGNSVTRAQMAIFLLRGIHGSAYTPPAATGTMFSDVSAGSFAAAWIEQLANEGITSGCGGGKFCPNTIVTRAQMAVFLVKARHGVAFVPPTATGVFSDVPVGSFGANYIEQLVADGVTSGCGGGLYCPNSIVKRDSMAVFLVKTFNLP